MRLLLVGRDYSPAKGQSVVPCNGILNVVVRRVLRCIARHGVGRDDDNGGDALDQLAAESLQPGVPGVQRPWQGRVLRRSRTASLSIAVIENSQHCAARTRAGGLAGCVTRNYRRDRGAPVDHVSTAQRFSRSP